MQTSENGKESTTQIRPLTYNKTKNQTLVEAIPHTGRQQQIIYHIELSATPSMGFKQLLLSALSLF